jgi:hypothetical protein
MSVSGRMRLMVMERGKAPVPLLKAQDESAAPMTALTGNRIAFAIGPEPRETIAVADTQTGRIAGRISPGKGVVQTLAASGDGATLYFTAGGSVWSVASAGGDPRRICAGDWVVTHPSGTPIVTRNEAAQIQLFEVDAVRGTGHPGRCRDSNLWPWHGSIGQRDGGADDGRRFLVQSAGAHRLDVRTQHTAGR